MFPALSYLGLIGGQQAQDKPNESAEEQKTEVTDSPPEEKSPEASSFWFSDLGSLRLEAGLGKAWSEVSNKNGPDHDAYVNDFRAGFDFNVGPITLGPELTYSYRDLVQKSGGVSSYLNKHSFILGGRIAYEPIPQWLNLFAGAGIIGITSINSGKNTDGTKGEGLRYGNNFLKYNVKDERTFAFQFRAGVGSEFINSDNFGLGLNAYLQLTSSQHELYPDAIDRSPSDPAIPVDASDSGVFVALVARFGAAPESRGVSVDEVNTGKVEEAPETEAPASQAIEGSAEEPKTELQTVLDKINEISQNTQSSLSKNYSEAIANFANGINVNAESSPEKEAAYERVKNIHEAYRASVIELRTIIQQVAELKALTKSDYYQNLGEKDLESFTTAWDKMADGIATLRANLLANRSAATEAIENFQKISGLNNEQKSFAADFLKTLNAKPELRAKSQKVAEQPPQTIDAVDGACPEGYSVTVKDGDKALKCTQQ